MWLNKEVSLVIVDDHPIVAEGLLKLFSQQPGWQVTGCFRTGATLLEFMREGYADVILLDIALPDYSGLDLCREIKSLSPDTTVLAFSNHSERSVIMRMLQNGAGGYLLKTSPAEEVLDCIRESLAGEVTFSKEVKGILARPTASAWKDLPRLTKREKEILQLLSEGETTVDIAARLSVSPLTIETHRRNLLQKFEVKNVAALVRVAVQHRLL